MKKEKEGKEKRKKENRFYMAYSDEELDYFLNGAKEGIKPEILWKNYCERFGRQQYSSGTYIRKLQKKLGKKHPIKWSKKNIAPYISYIYQQDRLEKKEAYIAREQRFIKKQLRRLGIKKVRELNNKRARDRIEKNRPAYNRYQRKYTKKNPGKRKKAVNKYKKKNPGRDRKVMQNLYIKDKALLLKRRRNCEIIKPEAKKIRREKIMKKRQKIRNKRLKECRRKFKLYLEDLEKRIEYGIKPIIYPNILKLLDLGFKVKERTWTGHYLAKKLRTSRENMNIYKKYSRGKRRQMPQEALEILLKETPVPIRKIPLIINNISNYEMKEKKILRKKPKQIGAYAKI